MKLYKILSYLREFFLEDFPSSSDRSRNGLQVEGSLEVSKITTAVDACLESFEKSAQEKSQLLLVHHGLFWGSDLLIVGNHGKRISTLIKNDISLYAMHLPLDMHPKIGNNALLASALGLKIKNPFGVYNGIKIGVEAQTPRKILLETFVKKVEKVLNSDIRLLPFGPKKIRKIGIVSGGGSSEIIPAARCHLDLLITGEGGHISYHQAKEHKMNVIYGGHYATETFGIKALGEHLSEEFGLKHVFLDIPTGF